MELKMNQKFKIIPLSKEKPDNDELPVFHHDLLKMYIEMNLKDFKNFLKGKEFPFSEKEMIFFFNLAVNNGDLELAKLFIQCFPKDKSKEHSLFLISLMLYKNADRFFTLFYEEYNFKDSVRIYHESTYPLLEKKIKTIKIKDF